MKIRIPLIVLLLLLVTMSSYGQSQFDVDAQIRPRFESRDGFRFLPVIGEEAASFINQRTRLTFGYSQSKLNLKVSINNHKIWGDIKTLGSDDEQISFHEAWAEALFSDKFSVKFGRQEIIYDDQRIFGSVDWVQQARSHDAMVAKWMFTPNNRLDMGIAYNANGSPNKIGDGAILARTPYTMQYKAFQYAWYHAKMDRLGLSILFLNNGIEYTDNAKLKIGYSQTIGSRLTYKSESGKFISDASYYLQGGKQKGAKVSASNFAVNLKYKLSPDFLVGAGYEMLSGNDLGSGGYSDVDGSEINAFNPFYGTNHKFNGWMDHFYVGTWGNGVGLNDLNFVLAYTKNKFSAKLMPHFFSAAGKTGGLDDQLGTEIDVMLGYKIAKDMSCSVGYSHLSGKNALVSLQGGNRESSGSVAYIQFNFAPKLLSIKK